jgi:hypothetical protein
MSYRFKFGRLTSWMEKWFHADAKRTIFEAHAARGDNHTALYVYNDDASLCGIVELTPEWYERVWSQLYQCYGFNLDMMSLTKSDKPGYKCYCLLRYLKRGNHTEFLKASHWLEQEYLKNALNHHQAAAQPDTTGPEDTEGSPRGADTQA